MTDPPRDPLPPPESDHAWVHENLAAYLAGGLDSAERARLDSHVNACQSCFDDFTEARDADRLLQRTLAPLQAAANLEDRLVTHFREKTMNRLLHPLARRAAYSAAAAVALAATGVFANYAIRQSRLNNPLSEKLVADADQKAPELAAPLDELAWKFNLPSVSPSRNSTDEEKTPQAHGKSPSGKMSFHYENTPVSQILDDIGSNYGVVILQPATPVPGNITFKAPNPLSRAEAQGLLNDLLVPLGFTAIESHGASQDIWRIVQVAESKKLQIPVREGINPSEIPVSEELITQVMPLKHADAVRLRSDLTPLIRADADVTANAASNTIVVTDTAAKIHRLAEIISKVDQQAGVAGTSYARAGVESMRQNIDSAEHLVPNPNASAHGGGLGGRAGGSTGTGFGGGGGFAGDSGGQFAQAGKQFEPTFVANGKQPMAPVASPSAPPQGVGTALAYGDAHVDFAQPQHFYSDYADGGLTIDSGGILDTRTITRGNADKIAELNKSPAQSDGLTKVGSGTVTLSGANTYYGATTVNAGTGYIPTNGNAGTNLGINSGRTDGVAPADVAFRFGTTDARTANGPQTWNFNGGNLTTEGKSLFNEARPGAAGVPDKPAEIASAGEKRGASITGGGGNGATAVADLDANGNLRGITVNNGDTVIAPRINLSGGGGTSGGKPAAKSEPAMPGLQVSQQLSDSITLDAVDRERASKNSTSNSAVAVEEQREKTTSESGMVLGRHATELNVDGDVAFNDSKSLYAYNADSQVERHDDLGQGILPKTIFAYNDSQGSPTTQPGRPSAPPAPQTQPAVEQQSALKIIRNGTVAFEVRNFDDAYQTVARIVTDEGGYVSSTSSDKLANGKVRGTITVRVPPSRLDRFLLEIRSLGELKAQQIGNTDVTKDYFDTESELRGLRVMETRLLDLIKNGKGEVKDLIAAEAKLGETRVQIEKLEGTINYYNNLVSMATITITAFEKDIQTPTAASEQEIVNLNVETEEVETKYQNARKILGDAKARIVESQLKNTDADHVAAHIVAEVPPDAADFVSNQLKQLGKVSSFNRDRRQTATGGTGQPAPGVQVEKKDTRITIDLYNLANLAPRETTVLRVAVRDVESSYKTVLAMVRKDAPQAAPAPAPASQPAENPAFSHTIGRVVSSNLAGQLPEQMSADIRAELRADQADAVLAAIRDSGETLTSSLATNSDNAGTTSAKRGLQLQLISIAAVAPKDATTMNIAVTDVDATYKKLLALIRADVPPAAAPAQPNPLLPPTTGRVLNSNLNGQQPEQMVADIRAEIRTDQFDALQQALRDSTAGGGEIMNSSNVENPDQVNSTRLKRGLQVRFINVAAIPARETIALRTIAADVPDAFNKLVRSLQALVGAGNARIIASQFNQTDARNVNASLAFEVRRESLAAVEKAIADAGIDDSFSRNIVRSTDTANTLDTKVRINIDEIRPADSLDPRRTIILGIEVADVESAVNSLRGSLAGQPVREVDSNLSRDPSGRQTAHLVLDVPYGKTLDIVNRIRDLHGTEKDNQVTLNNNVPEIRLAKERIELTLTSRASILQSDKGLWQSVRAALSSSAGALLYSVYLVLTGILFVLPFILLLWPLWLLMKRRKTAAP